jgi:hypothetical protein
MLKNPMFIAAGVLIGTAIFMASGANAASVGNNPKSVIVADADVEPVDVLVAPDQRAKATKRQVRRFTLPLPPMNGVYN